MLVNKPLVTDAMLRFRQILGTHLTTEQADALALSLSMPEGEPLTLTAIRSLGISTTQQARRWPTIWCGNSCSISLSDTQFQARESIRQRFCPRAQAQATDEAGTRSGPSRDQVGTKSGLSAEQHTVLAQMTDEHDIATLMEWVGRNNRSKFREAVLTPLLALDLVEMTIPDKPNSSKQRYRLTAQGKALRDEVGK